MNNSIYPCIWCNNNASEMAFFYKEVFEGTKILSENKMVINLTIGGHKFMLLNGGPMFKPNACISYYVTCETDVEVDNIWGKLSKEGKVMMPLNEYPWNKKYGWITDKYGVSWQLTLGKISEIGNKIVPTLMFTGKNFGKGEDAINFYIDNFPDSNIQFISKYDESDKLQGGKINHGRFQLCGQTFIIMDSGLKHDFNFTEGQSFVINCENQVEINKYWSAMAELEQQCGWIKDKFGVSWQVLPTNLGDLISSNPKAMDKLIKMKKIDIETLKN